MADDPTVARHRHSSPWPAVTLVTLATLGWFWFQTVQLVRDGRSLAEVRAAQEPAIGQAQKLRDQLDSIARATLELAQRGNPSAALIVQELARRGVTINPQPPASSSSLR